MLIPPDSQKPMERKSCNTKFIYFKGMAIKSKALLACRDSFVSLPVGLWVYVCGGQREAEVASPSQLLSDRQLLTLLLATGIKSFDIHSIQK